jgi:hypothetical protein
MASTKRKVISQTLNILEKRLNEGILEEGFEFDQEKDAIRIIADWANHLSNAVR